MPRRLALWVLVAFFWSQTQIYIVTIMNYFFTFKKIHIVGNDNQIKSVHTLNLRLTDRKQKLSGTCIYQPWRCLSISRWFQQSNQALWAGYKYRKRDWRQKVTSSCIYQPWQCLSISRWFQQSNQALWAGYKYRRRDWRQKVTRIRIYQPWQCLSISRWFQQSNQALWAGY